MHPCLGLSAAEAIALSGNPSAAVVELRSIMTRTNLTSVLLLDRPHEPRNYTFTSPGRSAQVPIAFRVCPANGHPKGDARVLLGN